MSFATDIAGDFAAVADGLESATLFAPSGSSAPLTALLRRAITTKEAAESNGKYTTADFVMHFPVSAANPIVGGTLVVGSDSYTILDISKQTLRNRWRCMCRLLAIATDDAG